MRISSAQVERYAPFGVAVLVAGIWWYFDRRVGAAIAKELLAALLAAAAIAAGFLTTALSILLALLDSPVMRQLKRAQYDDDVYEYLRGAINACLMLAALCVAAFFFYEDDSLPRLVEVLLVFQTAYAGVALVRISEALLGIFRRALKTTEDGSQ